PMVRGALSKDSNLPVGGGLDRAPRPRHTIVAMENFSPEIVDAVLRHMNTDHRDDNVVIVRANGAPDASDAEMTALDTTGGVWRVTGGGELRIPWTVPVTERADIRRAVVLLYRAACAALGVEPRTEQG
ncbi:DUF2470 domain-containing protein, partial [Kitasatospora herbaricolor]|uniref:DUF2470 domain-containing protein n=1 Tax=Kitasatospora herbaricolor TaxID=68217 RepID=UPI0036DE7261